MPSIDGSVFRLFVSSTFADFETEREILQGKVFPCLRERAMAVGARVVPIDLRWGISQQAVDQLETIEICLAEVDRCQAEGEPPRLLALVGHRRGWRPLPGSIPADVWEGGVPEVGASGRVPLERAYRLDRNARPASWVLQPNADEKLLYEDVTQLVRAGSSDERLVRSLLGSATEQELLRAFTERCRRHPAARDAIILVRKLPSLPKEIKAGQEHSAGRFLELCAEAGAEAGSRLVDEDACTEMGRLAEQLAAGDGAPWARLSYYEATWDDAAAEISLSEEQRGKFAALALDELSRMMNPTLELDDPAYPAGYREKRSRTAIRDRYLTSFTGRDRELAQLRGLVRDTVPDVSDTAPARPVVIVSGPTGSGKSALMAKAAERAGEYCTVITRFAGSTRTMSSAAGLCRSINLELAERLGIGSAYARREDLFAVAGLLTVAARQGRGIHSRSTLAVFIDAVDLISGESGLRWLPPAMPPQVTLVLSAHEDSAQGLAERFDAHELVRLGPLSPREATQMLNEILSRAGRDLTPEQRDALLTREHAGWLPLSLGVAAQDALRWHSYMQESGLRVATTFSDAIEGRLSDPGRHGTALVASALGYLLAARDGLAEDELRDLLAQDQRVIADLTDRKRFPYSPALPGADGGTPRVPDVVLSRLLLDLSPYLLEYPVDGQAVLRLAHEDFKRLSRRHVARTDGRPAADWHRRVAGYYRGQWDGQRTVNRRVVTELPYQLAKAGHWGELTAIVSEFSYLRALVTGDSTGGPSAEAAWSAGPALADLLTLAAEPSAQQDPAAGQAAQVLRAARNAVTREQRYIAEWPEACWQQLANRLLPDPGVPTALRESFERESTRSRGAWLEMLPGTFLPDALVAACRLTDAGREGTAPTGTGPTGTGQRGRVAVAAMIEAPPHEALIVMDQVGGLASWDPAAPAAPVTFRSRDMDKPGLTVLTPLGDGRVLACDEAGALELWDVPRQRKQREPVGSLVRGITAMTYFPAEHCLVTATGAAMRCWDFDGSAPVCRLPDASRWDRAPGATWLWHLPGGRLLAVGRQQAACLSVAEHSEHWREAWPADIRAAAIDRTGTLMALADSRHRVSLRQLDAGAPVGTDLDAGGPPTALAFAASDPGQDPAILVGRDDGWLVSHPALGSSKPRMLPAHGRAVRTISVRPRSAQVITGGSDGWIKSWDPGAGEWQELAAARRVQAAAFDATGRWALACCADGASYRVGAEDCQWVALAGLAAAPGVVPAALPEGLGFVVSLRGGALGWLRADGETVSTIPLPPAAAKVTALAATADRAHVLAADSRGGLTLVPLGADSADGAVAGSRATAGGAPITLLACLPDGSGALSCDGSGVVTRWTVGPGGLSPGRARRLAESGISALAVVLGGTAVLVCTQAGDVALVRIGQPGAPVRLGRQHSGVTSIAVGLGGQVAVTTAGGDEPAIYAWDLEEGRLLTRLPLPDEPVAAGFLQTGPELAVAGRPGRIWRMRLHLPDVEARERI